MRRTVYLSAYLSAVLAWLACGSSTDVGRGNVALLNSIRLAGGAAADTNGVILVRDATDSIRRALIDSTMYTGLAAGAHVFLITDLAANCSVDAPNPRNVIVVPDTTLFVFWGGLCQ